MEGYLYSYSPLQCCYITCIYSCWVFRALLISVHWEAVDREGPCKLEWSTTALHVQCMKRTDVVIWLYVNWHYCVSSSYMLSAGVGHVQVCELCLYSVLYFCCVLCEYSPFSWIIHVNMFVYTQRYTVKNVQVGINECVHYATTHMNAHIDRHQQFYMHTHKQSHCLPAIDIPHSCGLHAHTSHHRLPSATTYNGSLQHVIPLSLSLFPLSKEWTIYNSAHACTCNTVQLHLKM